MRAEQAVAILDRHPYKPGYQVSSRRLGEYLVSLEMEFPSYNSTPEWDGSNEPAVFYTPPILIDVRSLDEEGVEAAGLNALLEVEAHESREFWRRRPDMVAPFHPHNHSGEAAWQRTRAIPVRVMYPPPNGA